MPNLSNSAAVGNINEHLTDEQFATILAEEQRQLNRDFYSDTVDRLLALPTDHETKLLNKISDELHLARLTQPQHLAEIFSRCKDHWRCEWVDWLREIEQRLENLQRWEEQAMACSRIGADYHGRDVEPTQWYVQDMIPCGEIGVCHGGKGHLKTSSLMDLAVSLVTGTDFLGRFTPNYTTNVLFFHAEDSEARAHHIRDRIARARGVDPISLRYRLLLSPELPRQNDPEWCEMVVDCVRKCDVGLVVVEGIYLSADADQRSLTSMGAALAPLKEIVRETGCTLIPTAHDRQVFASGWPTIRAISGVGYEELARFSLSINTDKPWDPVRGEHHLRLTAATKYGATRMYLNVREGLSDDPGGQIWETAVTLEGEQPAAGGTLQVVAKLTHTETVLQFLGDHPGGIKADIVRATGLSQRDVGEVLAELAASNRIKSNNVTVKNRQRTGFWLRPDCSPEHGTEHGT